MKESNQIQLLLDEAFAVELALISVRFTIPFT